MHNEAVAAAGVSSETGTGSWETTAGFYREKLLLNGQMTPRGLEILQTQTEHHCTQSNCVYVAVQHRGPPLTTGPTQSMRIM